MFSENLERSLNQANQLARELKCQYITLEHLLLALLDNPEARDVLLTLGVDIDAVRVHLRTYIEKNTQKQAVITDLQLEHNDAFKRTIQRAIFHTQTLGCTEVTGSHVLAGIMSEADSHLSLIHI